VIILGATLGNKSGDVGFLRDERRFNVAMTRAKRLFILVGNSKTLTSSMNGEQKLTKKYLDNVKKYGDHILFDHESKRFVNKDPKRDRSINISKNDISDTLDSNSAIRVMNSSLMPFNKKKLPTKLENLDKQPLDLLS
jgi:AAA domain